MAKVWSAAFSLGAFLSNACGPSRPPRKTLASPLRVTYFLRYVSRSFLVVKISIPHRATDDLRQRGSSSNRSSPWHGRRTSTPQASVASILANFRGFLRDSTLSKPRDRCESMWVGRADHPLVFGVGRLVDWGRTSPGKCSSFREAKRFSYATCEGKDRANQRFIRLMHPRADRG